MSNSFFDTLLDENNSDNIILYNEHGNPIEFAQIAIIPIGDNTYALLQPVEVMDGMSDDEALVFRLDIEDGEEMLVIEMDEAVIDAVFDEYYKLLEESSDDE